MNSEAPGKTVRLAWLVLAVGYLAFSATFSARAPVGSWPNTIFGTATWDEADPGSAYMMAAHDLTPGEAPLFVGHPGSTLLIVLSGIQHGYYAFSRPEGFTFTEFTARNLPEVFLASKVAMTLLHLLSFWALFHFATILLRDRRAAHFATLAYATSLPVLYFLSRISVEPLMVLFFLASFMAIWRHQDLAAAGRVRAAFGWVVLAAALAVSGTFSKANFLAPLPFLLLACLLVGPRGRDAAVLPMTHRVQASAAFIGAAAVMVLLYGLIFDWTEFYAFWVLFAEIPETKKDWDLLRWLPGLAAARILMLSEFFLILGGLAGWVLFVRSNGARQDRIFWVSVYGGFCLLLWGYRSLHQGSFLAFHYFFLPIAILSVFFGSFTVRALRRLPGTWPDSRRVVLAIAGIAAIHGVAVTAVVDSRRSDAGRYAVTRGSLEMMSRLKPGEKLYTDERQPLMEVLIHSIPYPIPFTGKMSTLRSELDSLVVRIPMRAVDPSPTEPR